MKKVLMGLLMSALPAIAHAGQPEVFVHAVSLDSSRENLSVEASYCGDTGNASFAIVNLGSTSEDSANGGGPNLPFHYKIQPTAYILEQCVRPIFKTVVFNLKALNKKVPGPSEVIYVYGDRETRSSTNGSF
jgi:hypothetical protein